MATIHQRRSAPQLRPQLRKIRGVNFLRLRGDVVERARQHASLLKDEIRRGAIPALAKKNEWVIRRSPGLTRLKPVADMVVAFYKHVLIPRLERNNPPHVRELIRVMSQETGMPPSQFLHAMFQADGLMLLSRLSVMKYVMGDLPAGGLPGCSSAVVTGDWTRSGNLMALRNQDYPMVGPWEPNTVVMFHEPSEKDEIPHVAISTAGVHASGLTGMNREGLTVFTHAHFARKVRLSGNAVVDVGNEIVKRARTIGEAVDIARRTPPYANWSFIVTSAREKDAVAIERSPSKMHVRHARNGYLSHTNYFHSPELQSEEALLNGAYCEDLISRICRLRQALEPHRGSVDATHMARALGDSIDYFTGEERLVGNTVSVVTTVKSAIFEPEAHRFWVGFRGESPLGLGDYVEIDTERFWETDASDAELETSLPTVPGYRPRDPRLIEGMKQYREAYRAWHMENHEDGFEEKTLIALRKAVRAFPTDGNLWVQAGIVAFHVREFQEARSYFEAAASLSLSRHIEDVCRLYLARCLDLTGERDRALELYWTFERVGEPKLRRAMRRGISTAYRAHETGRMMLDLQFPDTFHY